MQLTETRRDLLQMVESFADAEV
jgi:isovaleryl-CoA dehydrogenase